MSSCDPSSWIAAQQHGETTDRLGTDITWLSGRKQNLGVFKISLAEATYVIQDSQIGDWELHCANP
jgi:hypothetical protein